MCSNVASSSTIFCFFNFSQRTEGGVPARNPKKKLLDLGQRKSSLPRSLSGQRRHDVAALHRLVVISHPVQVHLWFCFYMNENEGRESFLSQETIEAQTGMSKNTIWKWQRYLLKCGWLVDTGAKAADQYKKPTRIPPLDGGWRMWVRTTFL
jgi:biotin operon repressor